MDAFRILGGRRLEGTVEIAGAKNAALPIMAAALLIPGRTVLRRVPALRDVTTMSRVLEKLGASCELNGHVLDMDATELLSHEADWDLVRRMRASIYVLGPLLARRGKARVSLPGGCAWGPRPVNLHLKGMEALGAEVTLDQGYIVAEAPPGGLRGAHVSLDVASVGATGNILMAAVLAKGRTIIENAAKEPDIVALADFLSSAGASISGAGTSTIEIDGVSELKPTEFENIPDRIETGTFLAAAAITGGAVHLTGVRPDHLPIVFDRLTEMGVRVSVEGQTVSVEGNGKLQAIDITTQVHPGFPTDLQAIFMALLCVAEGSGVIKDTIYGDRFSHVPELRRLGANIRLDGNVATVKGARRLQGANVLSTDLRASCAMVLAGLVAEGETVVHRVYHIDRGYEQIEVRLASLGAQIERFREEGP